MPAGLGPLPLHSLPRDALGAVCTSSSLHLSLAHLSGWGWPLVLTKAAMWQLGLSTTCLVAALSLGPHPSPEVPMLTDETTLCPRFRLSQSPLLRVLPHRDHVFKIGKVSQQTALQKRKMKQKTLFIFLCVPKTVDMLAQHPQDQAVA